MPYLLQKLQKSGFKARIFQIAAISIFWYDF